MKRLHTRSTPPRSRAIGALVTATAVLAPTLALAGGPPPAVGATNTATADPRVSHPPTTPCRATLFSGLTFADYTPKSFSYAAPAACAGPWAKVVFEGDFAVTSGNQFDRTANVWIGGTNVYFGTTSEPTSTGGKSWHVERDLTDYGALLAAAQSGTVVLGNTVNSTYTGVLSGTADLAFYPPAPGEPAPRTADAVLSLSAGPTGGTVALDATTSTLSQTFTLPTNVERAYLDVIAQSQNDDEFWYTCVPDDVASEVQSCGGTGFRETEIAIDGIPAGVAPVYPWIFTGGIDPFLWAPIPGVQTLDLAPYRVDLTPFAGVLSNGSPHTITVSVFNADDYFSTTAALLLYTDHGRGRVTGAVTSNTLSAAPSPTVTNGLQTASDGSIGGTVTVASTRKLAIAGYVDTSHGRVSTEVAQEIAFSNAQTFTIDATTYVQDIALKSTVSSLTTTREGGSERTALASFDWPLTVDISAIVASDGSSTQTTSIVQGYHAGTLATVGGSPAGWSVVSNTVSPTDTLEFDATGAFTGNTGTASTQTYFQSASGERCYARDLVSASGAVTNVTDGAGCRR